MIEGASVNEHRDEESDPNKDAELGREHTS